MIWTDWGEFFAMGGYGVYVWSACLGIAAALFAEQLLLRWRRRSILDHLGKADSPPGSNDETAR